MILISPPSNSPLFDSSPSNSPLFDSSLFNSSLSNANTTANVANSPYCSVQLDQEKLKAFIYAVKNDYIYQMYMDDLPLWTMVGEQGDGNSYYLWTHKKFEIGWNEDRIVDVNLISEHKQKLELNANITFSYEVIWRQSSINFEDRYNKLLDQVSIAKRVQKNSPIVLGIIRLVI